MELEQLVVNAPAFFMGSTEDEVLIALGAPSIIFDRDPNQWY
jgi:hypothetical protein